MGMNHLIYHRGKNMSYNYETERHKIFTDEGQRRFLLVRDRVKKLLETSGAFSMCYAFQDLSGDVWEMMSHVDRLVELGEIKELTRKGVHGQDRVFTRGYK
jgi:hypothetical protein